MTNSMKSLIEQNKEWILKKWLNRRLALFSKQKHSLIATQMDQFQNPIRHEIFEGLKVILDNFETKGEKFTESLDQISRVLAIQDFPPSRAMSLFYELKEIIQERAKKTGVSFGHKE